MDLRGWREFGDVGWFVKMEVKIGLLYANSRFEVIVTGERSFYAILWI